MIKLVSNIRLKRLLFLLLLGSLGFVGTAQAANLGELLGFGNITPTARTDSQWDSVSTYLKTTNPLGFDILINGIDRYLNFNAASGESGYGIRDNSGTIECKDSGGAWSACQDGGGGGSAVILDLADDSSNESVDIKEIATTGDTNSIFTEPAADKLLIDLGNDWPKADTADDLTCTDCINATEIEDIYLLLAGDSSSGNYTLTGDWDFSGGGIEIENGTTPPACTEGQLFLDTDATAGQQLLACDGGTFVLQGDGGGAETNDLESVATSAGSNEIFVGSGVDSGTYIGITACAADEKIEYTDGAPNTFTCEAIGGLVDADISNTLTASLITVADTTDTTSFVALWESATGDLEPKSDLGLTYNAATAALTATTFVGQLTGNSSTATALAANGGNCSAGSAPLGVDASGAVESCTDYEEDLSNSAGLAAALSDETGTGLSVFATAPTFTTSIAFNAVTDTIAGIQNQNLLDKTATEAIIGDWNFGAGGIEIENATSIPVSCTVGQLFMDTDATTGQQLYGCEAGTFVLQGDGAGGGSSEWTDLGSILHPNETADDIALGNITLVNSSKLSIDGDADQVQFTVQGFSTQTDSIFIVENSGGTEVLTIDASGLISSLVGFDGIGAIDLDYGSVDITDHTFITDGTGTGEIVLPAGSIDGTEILDDTIGVADFTDNDWGEATISGNVFTIDPNVIDFDNIIYSNTLAGNPALLVDECFLLSTSTGGGFICEGSTANTNEQLYLFPDVDGADTTNRIVVDNTEVTSIDGTGLTISGGVLEADLGTTITSSEITDNEIVNADINSAAAIAISKTALIAGTNISLSTNTLNVDDAFIINSGSDVMTGTLTADGLTLGANENITLGAQTLDHDGTNFVFNDSVQFTAATLYIQEQADADAEIAGYGQLWVNTATPNELFFTDDAGTDFQLGVGGGAETNSLETTITGILDTEIFIGDGANSGTFSVISGDATLANTGALSVIDLTCTDCINATEIEDIYLLNGSSDVMAGTLTADGLTLGDDENVTLGTASDWTINFDDSVDDQLLFLTAATAATATTDPLIEFLVGTTPTADQEVFGIAKGTQATNTQLFTVDEDGDVVIGPATAGDSIIDFFATTTRTWTLGLDDSDTDAFKISTSADFASGNIFTITTGGDTTIGAAGDDLITLTGTPIYTVSAGVTADTGSSQGDGPIAAGVSYVEISISANVGDAVTLPTAVAGLQVTITNHGANSADVFPATSDEINEASVNTAKAVAANATMTCYTYDATNWECLTLAR